LLLVVVDIESGREAPKTGDCRESGDDGTGANVDSRRRLLSSFGNDVKSSFAVVASELSLRRGDLRTRLAELGDDSAGAAAAARFARDLFGVDNGWSIFSMFSLVVLEVLLFAAECASAAAACCRCFSSQMFGFEKTFGGVLGI
jgi:hypothetical protein